MFKELKESITPQMAAERYGIKVSRNGMACCPFHDDKNPSLKLYDDHYYCFGCQKNGDVIDFTSRLFNITAFEAAQKLKTDFYINKERTSVIETLRKIKSQEKQEDQCFAAIREYLDILKAWKVRYKPKTMDEKINPRYEEACKMLECVQYIIDLQHAVSQKERSDIAKILMKDAKIIRLQERLREIKEEANEQ